MSRSNELEVAARWAGDGDGKRYVSSQRWKSASARSRDVRLVRRLLARLPAPPRRVLDVPCGTGRLRDAFAPETEWTGADVSREMLAQLGGDGHPLVQASAFELPFASDSFDLVLCCRLLHHLEAPDSRAAVLRELSRVSRAWVIASYWDAASYGAWRRRTHGPLRRRRETRGRQACSFAELSSTLERDGARVVARAHSLRFVSQQSLLLARVSSADE